MKNLKFIISVLALLLFCISCEKDFQTVFSEDYSNEYFTNQEDALSIANKTLFKNSVKVHKDYILSEIRDDNGEILIYIVNYEDGGFVIITGDKRTKPVIAFSKTNAFKDDKNDFPPNIRYWIEGVKIVIKNVRESNKKQSPEIKNLWDIYNSRDIDPEEPCDVTYIEGPLLNTRWGQGCYYNDDFPTESYLGCTGLPCDHAYTGCANTAMAQIMKFHEHPTSYTWGSMPNTYGSSATAELMFDIAEATDSYYYCDKTSTSTSKIVPAFENDFGYSTSAQLVTYYTSTGFNTIKSEILNDRPVLFVGVDPINGGHAWVADGYRMDYFCLMDLWEYYYHMNWGWNGNYNGYYAYDDFDPSIYEFNNSRKIVKGIKP